MPIDFTQLQPQIAKMGRMIAHKTADISHRAHAALEQFEQLPDNAAIQDQVQLARDRDAGYRGAAPISIDGEPMNSRHALPACPQRATVLATDGSQVYPDIHAAALYYLTNIACFTFYHGENHLPEELSIAELHYADSQVRDQYDQPVTNAIVNARRTVKEMKLLAERTWEHRHYQRPIIALFDGRLLFWLGSDVPDAAMLLAEYKAAFVQLHDTNTWMEGYNASLVGYIDRPSSRFVMSMMQLMILDESEIYRHILQKPGEYEGLDDRWLFSRWLLPGERSAVMIQQSPQNKAYRQESENHEITFFYVNVGDNMSPHIARVETPMWVARNPRAVNEVHALIIDQARLVGTYPYALTRADEIATVRSYDRQTLSEMIMRVMLENNQLPEISGKLSGKHSTRSHRQRFEFTDQQRRNIPF
jgi:hypothetical protein